MALGLFRGSFDIDAVDAIIPSQALEESSESLATSTFLPNYAFAKGKRRFKDDDSISIKRIGSQLSNLDEFGYDNDGAMSNESYGLLDSESAEEIMARKVKGICIFPLPRFSNTKMLILVMFAVPTAKSALRHLHQGRWSSSMRQQQNTECIILCNFSPKMKPIKWGISIRTNSSVLLPR